MARAIERLRRGMLAFMVLDVLKARPMHAYQVMKEIERRTGGSYKPSTGSLYPVLRKLVSSGAVEIVTENGKKTYRITEQGLKILEELKKEREEFKKEFIEGPKKELFDVLVSIGLIIRENRRKIDEEKYATLLEKLKECRREVENILRM